MEFEWIEFPVADAFIVSGRGLVIPVPLSFAARFVFGASVNVELPDSGVRRAAIVEAARHSSPPHERPVLVLENLTTADVSSGTPLRVEVRAA